MQPFTYRASDAALADLRQRLKNTRWPDDPAAEAWLHGTDGKYLRELVQYWIEDFDWRAQEAALFRFAHYRTEIDGFGIHFIHERGTGPNPIPLIITHGWPSSFVEMTKLIPLLRGQSFASDHVEGNGGGQTFDVIVPSLPGCGFSDRPSKLMSRTRTAALWAKLMTEVLGYRRFVARGADIGSTITTFLGLDHAQHVAAIHLSDVPRPYLGPGSAPLTDAEQKFLAEEADWMRREGAYDYIQATKPQTLGYALNDSPVGLAAWLVEKFRSWSDCHGDLERRFTKDELLTNITLYWLTETINSANRLYFDREHALRELGPTDRLNIPCAFAMFPADIDHPPCEYAERSCNVARWTSFPRGGHFAAFEEPELLAKDLREFFHAFR